MAADCYRNPRRLRLQLVFDSGLVLLLDGATLADVPTGTSRSGCLFPLSCYVSGKRRNRARQAGHVLIFRVSHKGCLPPPTPPPAESIHPFPLLIYVLFSLPFLWSVFLGAWSDNSVMNIRGWAASSHVSEARARAHASRVAASKPVPENGLPEWQQN